MASIIITALLTGLQKVAGLLWENTKSLITEIWANKWLVLWLTITNGLFLWLISLLVAWMAIPGKVKWFLGINFYWGQALLIISNWKNKAAMANNASDIMTMIGLS